MTLLNLDDKILMEVLLKNSFFTRSGKLTDAEILKIQELLTKTNVPIRDIALHKGRLSTAFWMQSAILLHYVRKIVLGLVKWFFTNDQIYSMKRRFYHPETK